MERIRARWSASWLRGTALRGRSCPGAIVNGRRDRWGATRLARDPRHRPRTGSDLAPRRGVCRPARLEIGRDQKAWKGGRSRLSLLNRESSWHAVEWPNDRRVLPVIALTASQPASPSVSAAGRRRIAG